MGTMATKVSEEPKPTAYGQEIIEALCGHLAKNGFVYRVGLVDRTKVLTKWLAAHLGRSPHSVAGAMSDLIEKGFLFNGHCIEQQRGSIGYHLREGVDLSITHEGWQVWSGFSKAKLLKQEKPFSFGEWLEWDGLDGTVVGSEWHVAEAKLFHLKG
jgi:hypothetical protein